MKIVSLVLGLLNSGAPAQADLFVQLSAKFDFDPLLVIAVAWKESRLRNGHCFRGSHGLMQIQLRGRSCRGTKAEADKKRLYDPRSNLTRGLELMSYWRKWGRGRSYHWLLHYNQGFGLCPDGGKRCSFRRRVPIQTGRIGGYADRVLRFYRRLKEAATCLRTGKNPSICRQVLRRRSRHTLPRFLPNV